MAKKLGVYLFRIGALILLLLTLGAAAAQANPFTAIRSGAKTVAVANGTKKVAMVPARGVQKVKNAF